MPSLVLVIAPRLLAVFLILTLLVRSPAQQPTPPQPSGTPAPPAAGQLPPGHPPTAQEPATGAAASAAPAGHSPAGGAPDGQEPGAAEAPKDPKDPKAKTPPRRGIPVDDLLVHTHCARCHALDDKSQMTRISYVRKSPEGWAESLKRMIRLHGLQVAPADAKQLVRSLANSHGLARSEAERGLYESERRVHWSEEQQDQDFRRACAECHPLGRVLLQQRDDEEWQLLRATHVAMFPLARGQMGGGPPEDESRRFGGGGPPGGAAATGGAGAGGTGGTGGNRRGGGGAGGGAGGDGANQGGPTQSVGDRVLSKLAKDQPLFSPAWEKWTKNRREVPLAGTWTVVGHETGRGDLRGTVELRRTDADEYDVVWNLSWSDGTTLVRQGKGLLYAGYSWRGRSTDPGEQGATYREVLLLDETWQTFRGRLFTGTHDELGADVSLFRHQQRPRVLALGKAAIEVPGAGQVLEVYGEAFPAVVTPTDLFVGQGVTIQAVERVSDRLLRVTVDVAAGTELGPRTIAFGSEPGSVQLQLYDTVDYVRITPRQGLSRIGGAKLPRQLERFEAFAVHRGPDGKPYTDDDVDLFQVRPRWALEEFRVREGDDDVQYVGSIDAASGLFTPNIDGPNPARKWSANNVGDVFVTATVELDVAVRPEPKPPVTEPKAGTGDDGKQAPAGAKPPATTEPAPAKDPKAAPAVVAPPAREQKTFRARSHLIVTVPLYSRWQSLDWEDR